MQQLFKASVCSLFFFAATAGLYAQNMGIGTDTPDPSAMLDVWASDKGLLVPRLTTIQRVAISNPATGLLVYDVTANNFWYFDGTVWVELIATGGQAGPTGPTGADGLSGITGITGPAGADGLAGATGIQGPSGADGSPGTTGATGATGPVWHITSLGYDNTGTLTLTTDEPNTISSAQKAWLLTGNAGTNGNIHFLGTTDNMSLNFRVNNEKAGIIENGTYPAYLGGNTAFGYQTLNNNTATGVMNTAIGFRSLYSNTGGSWNIAVGFHSLGSNISGNWNVAIGGNALMSNSSGYSNIAIGPALLTNSSGFENIGLGAHALENNTAGRRNIGIGIFALSDNTTGKDNIAIGAYTLSGVTGNNNIGIGYNANVPLTAGNHQVRIGNDSITYAGIQVPWTITSDRNWKSGIENSGLGLEFISKLRPVQYYRSNDKEKRTEYGFIAQEVEETLKQSGVANTGVITIGDDGMYGLRYNDIIAPLVKGMQEQQGMIQEQQDMIKELKMENGELKKRLEILEKR